MMECRDAIEALGRPAGSPAGDGLAAHLASCDDCRQRAADHERLVGAIRGIELDDVARARVLAQLAPELDALAERVPAAPRRGPRFAFGLAITAAACAAGAWWLARDRAPSEVALAELDHHLLRPYVIAGPSTDEAATTLLAGRFSALDVGAGQLVRATADGDRIAAVGPARVSVRAANARRIELDVAAGTLLVDAREPAHELVVHAGTCVVVAQSARFAVAVTDRTAIVFVDRGEIALDGSPLVAGGWAGPEAARSQALVAELREHGNAIAPPADGAGVAAIGGAGTIVTESGAMLGAAPLWARLPAGDVVLVAIGAGEERRTPVTIRDGETTRVAPSPPPIVAAPTSKSLPRISAPPTAGSASVRAAPSITDAPIVAAPTSKSSPAAATSPDSPPAIRDSRQAPHVDAPTASQLYSEAEAALSASDRARAEATLHLLVERYPTTREAASAHYDLATLARARGDLANARNEIARTLAGAPPAALREPATYLRCRLDADAGDAAGATACFRAFRRDFTTSAHDAEVLAWLAAHAIASDGCAAARPLADEYANRYPRGAFAARAKEIATCVP